MITPVNIQHATSAKTTPITPILALSISTTAIPYSPPQPLPKKPSAPVTSAKVSEPQMVTSIIDNAVRHNTRERSNSRKPPNNIPITGIRIPNTPNDLPIKPLANTAPEPPQIFLIVVATFIGLFSNAPRSLRHTKRCATAATKTYNENKRINNPPIQHIVSQVVRVPSLSVKLFLRLSSRSLRFCSARDIVLSFAIYYCFVFSIC